MSPLPLGLERTEEEAVAPAAVIETALPDVRAVPLGDLPALPGDVLGAALRRLVPAPQAVPVAAFNSSI